MNKEGKELYVQPALVKHELLRDITATKSAYCRTDNYQFSWFSWFGNH